MKNSKIKILKFLIFFFILFLFIIYFEDISLYFDNAERIIRDSGVLAPLVYSLLMILSILVVPIPSSPLAILGGVIFGPWLGMIYTLISATIGSLIAFSMSRFFFHEHFKNIEKKKFFKEISGKGENNIAYFVFLTRLMPQISFDIVSYLTGLTSLKSWKFIIATFLGMIPIVFTFSFFGYLIAPYKDAFLIIIFLIFLVYLYNLFKKISSS